MRRLNARGSSGCLMRLGGFCQRQAASPPSGLLPLAVTCAWVVSVSGRLLLRPRACYRWPRGGPLPLQARVLTAPKQRRRLQTQRPSGPSPCSCPVVDTPAAASRQPLPSGTVFAVFSPAGGFFPPPGTVFTDFGPVDGHSLPRGQLSPFSVPRADLSCSWGQFSPFSVPIGQWVRDISLEASLTGGGLTGRQN